MRGSATEVLVESGPNLISDLVITPHFSTDTEAFGRTPVGLRDTHQELIHAAIEAAPLEVAGRKGDLLFRSDLADPAQVAGWVMEGPGIMDFVDRGMVLHSEIPRPPDGSTGHFNLWVPRAFPASIVVEWEFKPFTDGSVAHFFFAARGKHGEDIFHPDLGARDGHFQQYINGDIDNYYVIYFSNIRMRTSNVARTWMCKSSKQSVVELGDIGVPPGQKRWYRIRLIKDENRIQLQVDDRVVLDWTDPGGDRWGPILGGGYLGFRQMARTMASYRNLSVWELLPR